MSSPRPIPTTGRTATRLSLAEKAAIQQQVAQHALPHPLPPALEIELGIGNGLALLARAQANPAVHFFGTEIYFNGLATLLHHLARTPQPNVSVAATDARTLLANLPAACAQRVLVLFPDPWPKASHHKRRLVQPSLLAEIARVLQPHGEFWLVTDWPSYAYHTLALLHAQPAFELAQTGHAASRCKVKNPAATAAQSALLGPHALATPPAWWQPTKYQAKAAAAGRNPWFISALRKP